MIYYNNNLKIIRYPSNLYFNCLMRYIELDCYSSEYNVVFSVIGDYVSYFFNF